MKALQRNAFGIFGTYSHSIGNLWFLQYVVVNIIIEAPYFSSIIWIISFYEPFCGQNAVSNDDQLGTA